VIGVGGRTIPNGKSSQKEVRTMRQTFSAKVIVLIGFFLLFGANLSGGEQKFPSQDIEIYVGFPPGGTTSAQAVVLAETMKKYVDVNVICQYKPGATQTIAADFVAKSKPDGYTLIFITVTDFIPKLIKDAHLLKFRAENFWPLGASTYAPVILAVSAESEWKSLEDLLKHARKVPPGTLSYASTGVYGMSHLAGVAFAEKAGIVLNHIPFQGGGPAQMGVLGRHADMILGSEGLLSARLKPGGGLRPLAVLGGKRLKSFPDVPTLKEKGYDLNLTIWWAVFAPAGVPKSIKEKLAKLYETAVKDPNMIAWMEKTGYTREYLTPKEVSEKMEKQFGMFRDILKKIK
jgi:tripartite-type tricarboxylate transporter receptor subunit TctC